MMNNDDVGISRRKKAKIRVAIFAVVICAVAGAYWYLKPSISFNSFEKVVSLGNSIKGSALDQVKQNFSAPPPLRAPVSSSSIPSDSSASLVPKSTLTRAGIIVNMNLQRRSNGNLPALSENATLDEIASLRLNDMFKKQYFAHIAPDGSGAESTAKAVGYAYLSIGENLALGNFDGDKGVVDAWMGSPGHRANILEKHYTEIGVTARSGVFEGETTWIAVQIFGRPASDCPAADTTLKATIDAAEAQITQIAADLQSKKSAMDAMQPKYGPTYGQKVDEYNAEVNQYNALVAQTKSEISQYNAEVAAFNTCIGS